MSGGQPLRMALARHDLKRSTGGMCGTMSIFAKRKPASAGMALHDSYSVIT